MMSLWVWAVSLALGVGATTLGAAYATPEAHMGLTALACLWFVILALLDRRRLAAAGAGNAALAGSTAAAMALVWAWAAVSLLLTYTVVLQWHEWWQYVLGAGVIAALCLFFAATMARDAGAGREDKTLLELGRYMTIGQLAGMLLAMVGLVLDDKMPRDPNEPDWAASAIFFFGAAALAAISINGLRPSPAPKS